VLSTRKNSLEFLVDQFVKFDRRCGIVKVIKFDLDGFSKRFVRRCRIKRDTSDID
jgi:hypothetical protein